MQKIKLVLFIVLTVCWCWLLNGKRGSLPPAGKLLNPFGGFRANMTTGTEKPAAELSLPGLKQGGKVVVDARGVPHIFAENLHDLYFLQGWATARDRLWQMEFQTHFAAGRLSEVIYDPRVVENDRFMRRVGLGWAAQRNLDAMQQDAEMMAILNAYSEGVNAWIQGLSEDALPFEYKLLDYHPEAWSPYKTLLMLKMMAYDLTWRSKDAEQSYARAVLSDSTYAELYPVALDTLDPIIPPGTPWNFEPLAIPPAPEGYDPTQVQAHLQYPPIPAHNGSNNWVVAGSRTASGHPILCNDPHLTMSLPSLWYEVQLHGPDCDVYGVSLPGAPFVIIGFNQQVAWGLTNGSRDVIDWYNIEFQDDTRSAYRFDGKWEPVTKRVETIQIRGQAALQDTILHTQHGPVVFDKDIAIPKRPIYLASRWLGHDPGEEVRSLYLMNRARNHADYKAALQYFTCPSQNFVFACTDGDIAITQAGKFPLKWKDQGRYILDGQNPSHLWQGWIPQSHAAAAHNPAQGFLMSANQVAADSTYPYPLYGAYETNRNRRIQEVLESLTQARPEDLQQLQNDPVNLYARDFLPFMLAQLKKDGLPAGADTWLKALSSWNYRNDATQEAPVYFELWYTEAHRAVWSDDMPDSLYQVDEPEAWVVLEKLRRNPQWYLADRKETPEKEGAPELLAFALKKAMDALKQWEEKHPGQKHTWQAYNNVQVRHLLRLPSFGHEQLPVSGNYSIVNAAFGSHGPSWRMVVEMSSPPRAWGIYPGGQSGNPGSPLYDNAVQDWAAGKYYELLVLPTPEAMPGKILYTQTLKPESK